MEGKTSRPCDCLMSNATFAGAQACSLNDAADLGRHMLPNKLWARARRFCDKKICALLSADARG